MTSQLHYFIPDPSEPVNRIRRLEEIQEELQAMIDVEKARLESSIQPELFNESSNSTT